jgi:hypothetical protein
LRIPQGVRILYVVTELKDVRITMTVAESDQDMLSELAKADDVSMSYVVRQLVRRAHAERFGESKRPKKK